MSDFDISEIEPSEHGPLIVKELSFSFWWENLEAIVEWLEALPEKSLILATIDTEWLKEAVINGFEYVFSKDPLTHRTLIYSGFDIGIHGLSAICAPVVHPVLDALHQPIIRRIKLHPDSDPKINYLSVVLAATLRERVGVLSKFDLDEVRRKYMA
jgi:hypothetical protein